MRAIVLVCVVLWSGSVFAGDDDAIAGEWQILSSYRGQEMLSRFTIERREDGTLAGTYVDARGGSVALDGVSYQDGTLRFERRAGGRTIPFEARVENGRLEGHHSLGADRIEAFGARGQQAFDQRLAEYRKANERGSDLEADYLKHAKQAVPRDSFPVLFDPTMVPSAEAKEIRDDEPVIGIRIGDEAKAYPIAIMGVHELVNDTCGGQPIAASW